ncbi:MAG: hypothetical protein K1X53_03745 [Candidatus Sumerlaeaceae bacterium]|nr:hypothetical protein [Candidatus Sumerlaeaceae bacterium]
MDDEVLANVGMSLSIASDSASSSGTSNNLFAGVTSPTTSGLTDEGALSASSAGRFVWTLIPTTETAESGPTTYWIGGTVSFDRNSSTVVTTMEPVQITVYPDASLTLDYFFQRDVAADDPVTADVVEPKEPFTIAVQAKNTGLGAAKSLKLVSSQPKIVENEKGLLAEFKLVGTEVAWQPVHPSLTVTLNDIEPGQTKTARWLLECNVPGRFSDFSTTFTHVSPWAAELSRSQDEETTHLSLIDGVNIHELVHVIQTDDSGSDDLPDFLVNDETVEDELPDWIYDSSRSKFPIRPVVNLPGGESDSVAATSSWSDHGVTVTVVADVGQSGWVYVRTDDVAATSTLKLSRVVRSDGKEIPVPTNAWTTYRLRHEAGNNRVEAYAHLVDYCADSSPKTYYLIYGQPNTQPQLAVNKKVMEFENHIVSRTPLEFQSFRVTNTGNGELAFLGSGLTLLGSGSSSFRFTSAPLDLSAIAAGQSRDFGIEFDPDAQGSKRALARIVTNSTRGAVATIQLSGEGEEFVASPSWWAGMPTLL